jgi:hypothetical protein
MRYVGHVSRVIHRSIRVEIYTVFKVLGNEKCRKLSSEKGIRITKAEYKPRNGVDDF